MRVHKVDVPLCELGEGPIWSPREQCLYYVDIPARCVHAFAPASGSHREWQFDKTVGSLALCRSTGLLVALKDEVVWFDPAVGLASLQQVVALERDRPLNRLNDGRVDPWGRFWVGSMQEDEGAPTGRLWCVQPDGRASAQRDGISVSNSIAFDRERHLMYFADSHRQYIERARFDEPGQLGAWAPFVGLQDANPDGSCSDSQGCLWNAEWGGSRVVRYTPDGTVDRVIDVPVPQVTCAAFGGKDFRTLFITTAHFGMSAWQRQQHPDSGSLYSVVLDDVQGVPENQFDR